MNDVRIRSYTKEDYPLIQSWWIEVKEVAPEIDSLPEGSTWILERNRIPWICVSVFPVPEISLGWVDNLIANPLLDSGNERRIAVSLLQGFIESWCESAGFKRMFCMSNNELLSKRYQELGYVQTGKEISTFLKLL